MYSQSEYHSTLMAHFIQYAHSLCLSVVGSARYMYRYLWLVGFREMRLGWRISGLFRTPKLS